MRKRAQRNLPHVRITLALLMTLMAALVFAGCGGGGSGPSTPVVTTPTSSATLATVTGTVTDTTAAATPIAGAAVQIVGTNLATTSAANGTFVILNVPVGTVRVAVVQPAGGQYGGYVLYQGKQYDTQLCPLTVTTTASGTGHTASPLPASIQLFPNVNGPPPPPATGANGCPL